MIRFAIVCCLLSLLSLCGSKTQGADSVDLVLVATAPPLFTKDRIEGHFAAGLRGVEKFGPLNDRLTVETISYGEYTDLKKLAENSGRVVENLIESPLVLKAVDQGWIVKAPDAGMSIGGIEIKYTLAGELQEQLKKFDVEAKDAIGEDVRFRVRSKVLGDYTFLPDPAWDLLEYRLLQTNGPATEWVQWPIDRSRFLIRVERFPADETSYAQLKSTLAANKGTPIRFNGEREGLFSIANMTRKAAEGSITSDRWNEGAYELSLVAPDTDSVWILFPLTKRQKDLAISQLKSAVKRQGFTERKLAQDFDGKARTVAGYVIAKKEGRELSARVGAQWQNLDAKGENTFGKTFVVADPRRWGQLFQKQENAYYVYVHIVNGEAATISEKGEFWGVESSDNWNAGQNPQRTR